MKQHVMLFEQFRDNLSEASAKSLRFKFVITDDYKYAGVVDYVKGSTLYIEINSEGDTVPYDVKNVYVIDMPEDEFYDILATKPMPAFDIDGAEPSAMKKYFDKYFKGNIVDAKSLKESTDPVYEGVLTIAGGIVLGLAGWWALKNGFKWLSNNAGTAIAVVADKVEAMKAAKEAAAENEKMMAIVQPIADKLSKDKKLMDMYNELPEYNHTYSKKAAQSNKERTKQLGAIAKYIKSQLTKEEQWYFTEISKLLRTGTLESADVDSHASFNYLEECLNDDFSIEEGTTPQFKKLMKRAKEEGIETDDELRDLIADEFDDENAPITGADYEIARKKLRITEECLNDDFNIDEGTTPQFKKLMKLARAQQVETVRELEDLISDNFFGPPLTAADVEIAKKKLKLEESADNSSWEDMNEAKLTLDKAKKEAQQISKEEGVTQHVNELPNGSYEVSDWYGDDTVISYENGRVLESNYYVFINEAKKIQFKRKYTENHPAKEVGLYGRVRDKVLEVMADKKMTQEEFDKIVSEFNLSKRWVRNNASLFKVKGGMVALSETGRRIWKAKSPKINEAFDADKLYQGAKEKEGDKWEKMSAKERMLATQLFKQSLKGKELDKYKK